MITKAIYNLYPEIVTIDVGVGQYDVDGNLIEIDEIAVHAEIARLQAEYDAIEYQRLRKSEYPPIGDQLDALWKGGDASTDMLAKVQAVKAKYPKPE